MNAIELKNDKKSLANSQDLIKDLVHGDPYALKKFDNLNLDLDAIKLALSFLTNNDNLSEQEKTSILTENWRINFRAKPPTPEEFLTEKYIGYTANTLYPRVVKAFVEFLDPTKPYRNLILYPHIGWGKDQPLDSKVYTSETEYKLMKDIEVGDSVLTPSGEKATVSAVIDWSEDDVYELELEDGKTMRCGPHHLHHVSYKKDSQGNPIWETVETLFLLEHPDYDFEFQEIFSSNNLLKKIAYVDREPTRCISLNTEEGLYITDNGIVTHNSFLSTLITLYLDTYTSLMRDPSRYFGLSKATSFSSMLISYSLRKSSELLVAPFLNILESSPYFEKVTRREAMQDLMQEFQEGKPVDKLYYTTAAKDKSSVLEFDSGLSIKVASSPQALLGLTLVSATFSELSFFTDAGKALDLDEEILMGDWKTTKKMRDITIGDVIAHPYDISTTVVNIPWQGLGDLYEIELTDGRTVKCHKNHLWPVKYWKDSVPYEEIVTTQFMIDNPEIDFEILEV